MLGVLVLARLLAPEDFGLVAMVVAVAGLGEVIREFGLGLAAIQSKVLTTAQRNNLFWANTALGCIIGLLFFGLSWPLAAFYGDERLVAITQYMSVTFVVNGMAAQYRAGLQRDLRYTGVVVADVLSMFCGVSLAIGMSLSGFGYWSIVSQQLLQPFVGLIIVFIASGWLPGRFRRRQGTRTFLTIGWHIFLYHIFIYASRNIDTVLVGARFGAASLGYYNRAFSLMTVPLGQFLTPSTRMGVSVLSRLQDDSKEFGRYLQRGQDSLSFVCLSMLAVLFGVASPAVTLLLGPNWSEVVPIFQILAVAGMFQVLAYPPVWAMLSLGHSRANLVQTIIARSALIGAVAIGSVFSVKGVAAGYAIGMALVWPISIIALARASRLPVSPLVWSACRHIVTFSTGAAIVLVSNSLFTLWPPLLQILMGVAIMMVYMACLLTLWPQMRRDALDVYRVVAGLRKRKAIG